MNSQYPPSKLAPCALLLAAIGLTAVAPTPAQGDEPAAQATQTQSFDIPAGSLATALNTFARQAGITLSMDPQLVADKSSPALVGRHPLNKGLQRLLAGTGLTYRFADGNTVTVLPIAENNEGPMRLDPIRVSSEWVTSSDYSVEAAPTSTKLNVPLEDLPQVVSVVTQQVLEDQQIVRLSDIANNVSGVTRQGGYGGAVDNFTVRGFAPADMLKNGFRIDSFATITEVANVENVQVLKGPIGALYGQNEPGGIVNVETKKPLDEPFYQFGVTAGSEDYYRATADLSAPLGNNTGLAYRLNIAAEDSKGFRDFAEREQLFLAPVVRWHLSDRTTLTIEAEYFDGETTFDRGFRPNPTYLELPIERFLGEPWNNYESTQNLLRYEIEHAFNDQWRFRHAVQANQSDIDIIQAQPLPLQNDGRTLNRLVNKSDEEVTDVVMQNEVFASITHGNIEHDAIIGLEVGHDVFEYIFETGPLDPIDIFAPQYGAQPGALTPVSWNEERTIDSVALYGHDLISFGERWKLLLGGRYDRFDIERDNLSTGASELDEDYSEFTPRAGLVYQPTESQSFFVSYSQSFNPEVFGRARGGKPLDPTTAEQLELGVKSEWFEQRVNTTVAAFYITKEDVPTTDPIDPLFSVQTGEIISRGLEIEAKGAISPGWQVIATYTYTDAFVEEDNNPDRVDDELVNVPENAASLWSVYKFQSDRLRGLSIGGGAFYADERQGRLPNSELILPDYVRIDAAAAYRFEDWKVQFNIKNLTDEEIYDSQGFFIEPQAPRTYWVNLTKQF